jgi:hypothetical protein
MSDLDRLCDQLRELQIRRKFAIASINRQVNATGALARIVLGWRYDMPEAERAAIAKRAAAIVSAAEKGETAPEADAAVASAIAFDLAAARDGIAPFAKRRHEIELEMARLARRLPAAAFQKSVRGFGERALAVVVGEAGNLANYPNPAKLWKRLGLAPHDGKAMSTWRREGGLSAEDWSDAGYSPRRRAEIYALISEPLFRSQTPVAGPYRAIYDARRARTAETHPDWRPARSHMDGLRIMTKHLVLDLWVEWRRAVAGLNTDPSVPAANLSPQGDPPAFDVLVPKVEVPGASFLEAAE